MIEPKETDYERRLRKRVILINSIFVLFIFACPFIVDQVARLPYENRVSIPRETKMAQGEFTKAEATECVIALNEIMKAFPKSKIGEFVGHFNDVFLFLSTCQRELKE